MGDTIYALATAPGRAGVAVVRISGPAAWRVGEEVAGRLPAPRCSALRILRDSAGDRIDEALVLAFEEGASYTGERIVELQVHGSVAVIKSLLGELGRAGLRLAEPGEFTKRALLNGRMSLSQVEGLGDLIMAETEAQRRQANNLLEGRLSERVELWRSSLTRAMALLTVTIDFADEDVPESVAPEVVALLEEVEGELEREIAGSRAAERVRDGFEVAIIGRPNAGKSTLLNYLAGRPAALTSAVAGTTRDVIEVRMDVGGLPVTLLDTAGLREAEDPIERMGVDLAVSRALAADLRVFIEDAGSEAPHWLGPRDIVIRGKADKLGADGISGTTGNGVDRLVRSIEERLGEAATTSAVAVNERHRQALSAAVVALRAAETEIGHKPEVAAEEIRRAATALERLVGRVDVEDVLDDVFARFCLGK